MSQRARVFGMVNMQLSWEYTSYALKTFGKYTAFSDGDLFVLVDDDGSFGAAPDWILPQVEVITNSSSKSFAQNINQVMRVADSHGADLYFFHNDLIFTDSWSDALRSDRASLLVPMCNQDAQYRAGDFDWKEQLILTDYTKRAPFLREVVKLHRSQQEGYKEVLSTPLHAVKIPREIYQVVGEFDENFQRLGGEDRDYCLRALQAGFKVERALSSFLLHFGGKSSVGGGESAAATHERIATCRKVFELKWGEKLARLVFDNDLSVLQSSPDVIEAFARGDFRHLLEILK